MASTGSACHADSEDPSAVLIALGIPHDQALGAVRLSLGRGTMSRWRYRISQRHGGSRPKSSIAVTMQENFAGRFINPMRRLWYNLTITAASVRQRGDESQICLTVP